MYITDVPTFWGNVIGLVAVAGKTLFDLVINKKWFDHDKASMDHLVAAGKKRDRADLSTALTFLVVGVGYAFSIWALIR